MRKILGILLLTIASLQAQNTVRGYVFDEEGAPVVGAPVEVLTAGTGALTNEDGLYSISDLPNGTHRIRVQYIGYDSLVTDVTLQGGDIKTLNLYLKPLTTAIVIVQGEAKIDRNRNTGGLTKIDAKDIARIPSLGMPDLSQYLQVVPGVVFTGDQGGQLYVRGGTPVQNMVLMDGAIMYNAFHSIGLYSVFDTDIIRDVKVYSAGFPAKYGGRVSSVMDISTRSGSFKRFHAKANINTISASTVLEGPILKKKGKELSAISYLLSARTLYLDKMSSPGRPYSYVNDTVGLPFNFVDLYGKVTLGNGANRANLFGFYQTDNVNYDYPSSYNWDSYGGGADFTVLPNGTNLVMTGNMAVSKYIASQTNSLEALPRNSEVGGFNSRLNFSYLLNTVNQFDMGLQFLGFRTQFAYANALGLTAENEDNNTEIAAYANYRQVFRRKRTLPDGTTEYFSRAMIEPGLRAHYYNDQNVMAVEPRISGKLNFKKFSIQASWGKYTQNLITITSDRDVVVLFQGYLAAPNDALNGQKGNALQQSTHYLLGTEFDIVKNTTLKVEGWYKDFGQLTNLNRNRLFPEEPTWITEKGHAYGVDLILNYKNQKGLYLYAAYGWAYNERNDYTLTYNPIWDRRHNLNVVASYARGNIMDRLGYRKLDNRWEFSARMNGGTGFPFTQTRGVYEQIDFFNNGSQAGIGTQNGNMGILLSNDYNGARLPDYLRVDLSVKRRFRLGADGLLEVNANVLNALNRDNIFYFDRILYERVNQLPLTPTLGVIISY